MLFAQVSCRFIEMEELEYSLVSDPEPYAASRQSRFNNPEIVAVLGDVVRKLRLLRGTRAAVGRKAFSADLKALATASLEDCMQAMNIAKPGDSISPACAPPVTVTGCPQTQTQIHPSHPRGPTSCC